MKTKTTAIIALCIISPLSLFQVGCTASRTMTRPDGISVQLEDAPAEKVWIHLNEASNKQNLAQKGLRAVGLDSVAELAAQFDDANKEANQAVERADTPVQLFMDMRESVVAELTKTLPAIAREKGYLQYLYVGRFEDMSARDYPELKVRLASVASYLQADQEFNDTVDILPSSFSRLDQVKNEIEQVFASESPFGKPGGVPREAVWVITGTFAVSNSKDNHESNAIINLELTNLGTNQTITRSAERTYYFHPAQILMRFISDDENAVRWKNWNQ